MRFASRLLVPLTTVVLVACSSGGNDDETFTPVSLAQRFLTAADAPGSKADPDEKRQTAVDLDLFMVVFSQALIDPDRDAMSTLFQEAGFKQGGVDTRFFGETHGHDLPHLFGSIIELQSEDGAKSVLDWLEADAMKPCPQSCAVQVSTFDVGDIPDARGVHRTATAEDIEKFGAENEQPSDGYWVGFTDGSIVYAFELHRTPGSVSEEQAQKIASAYYDRLTSI